MNFDDVFNAQNTNGISPEKLAFLKAMSARQAGGNGYDGGIAVCFKYRAKAGRNV